MEREKHFLCRTSEKNKHTHTRVHKKTGALHDLLLSVLSIINLLARNQATCDGEVASFVASYYDYLSTELYALLLFFPPLAFVVLRSSRAVCIRC